MDTDPLTYYRMRYGLSPQLAAIFDLLMKNDLTTATMVENIGTTRPYVAIKRLRQVMEARGIAVHQRYSLGYWIDPSVKQQVSDEKAKWESGEIPMG